MYVYTISAIRCVYYNTLIIYSTHFTVLERKNTGCYEVANINRKSSGKVGAILKNILYSKAAVKFV